MHDWQTPSIERLTAEYGTVPPPWVVFDYHPYSMGWRMGGGETHKLLWWDWWEKQLFTEDQRVEYFQRFPPPPCWLPTLIEAVWDVDTFHNDELLTRYLQRTEALGFGGRADYERDLNDPKWLES